MNFIRNLFGGRPSASPSGPEGHRAYAVGDIHGRLDLLESLLEQIAADCRGRPADRTHVIFLGDLIDRGPSSCQVVERLRTFGSDLVTPIFLMGNRRNGRRTD